MKNKNMSVIFATFSIIFLILLSITFFSLSSALSNKKTPNTPSETEYIYIFADDEEPENTESHEEKWIVKEYNGKIGIYDSYGTLLKVIETYIKTLPLAEQEVLREGFEITTEKELYSVIEDYTD